MKTPLNDQETLFVEHYLIDPNPRNAALVAGYAASTAKTKSFAWVSEGKCPMNKQHVLREIRKRQAKRSDQTGIDAIWVLSKLKLLADFNIRKFLSPVQPNGTRFYNFSEATDDDWYCISEYTTEELSRGQGIDCVSVDKIKIKAYDKLKALELAGKHVNVKAFVDVVQVEVFDKATVLAKARQRVADKNKESE